jgi:MFS family permease
MALELTLQPMAKTAHSSSARSWATLALLMTAALLSFLDRQVLAFLVEPIKAELHITDVQISLLQGLAFSLLYSIAAVPIGYWVDRANRHRIIMLGLLSWGAATIACGLVDSYHELFIARVLVGIGEATLMPAAYSLISDLFPPEKRARAFTLFGSAGIVGVALSFFLGGAIVQFVGEQGAVQLPLVGTTAVWQLVFIVAGLPAIALAGFMLGSVEPPRVGVKPSGGQAGTSELLAYVRSHKGSLAVVFASFGLSVFAGYGSLAWMAAAYARVYTISISQAGLISGIILLVAGFGGVLIGGTFADRWTRTRRTGGKLMIAFAAGLPASVCLSVWWMVDDLVVSAVVGVIGCSLSFAIGGVGPAALNDLVPNELRGKISAIYLLMTTVVGYAMGPFAVAYMTEHLFGGGAGVRFSLIALNIAFVLSALVAWFGRKIYWRATVSRLDTPIAST